MKIGSIYYINKNINDIKGKAFFDVRNIQKLRKMTEILIIDDEEFPLLEAIQKHGFSIAHKPDIQDTKDFIPYDIILCDIKGVGKLYGSEYEGAYLIKEAKKSFPNKQLIAYTASTYNPSYNSFLKYADAIIPKGTSLEGWIDLIDTQLRNCIDPIYQWKELRKSLFEAELSTIEVATFEQLYVKAIENKEFTSFEKLTDNTQTSSIIKQFLTSLIVRFIKGGI